MYNYRAVTMSIHNNYNTDMDTMIARLLSFATVAISQGCDLGL